MIDRLRDIVCDLSGHGPDEVPSDATFLELGFDSLMLTQLSQAFSKCLGAPVAFRQLMESHSTLQAVAQLAPAAAAPAPAPTPAAVRPTTSAAPVPTGELSALFSRQLTIMAEQLELLRAGGKAAAQPVSQPPAPQPPAASPKTAATPRKVPSPMRRERGLTAHQKRHLKQFITRYTTRTAGSKAAAQAHRQQHADPRTASGFDERYKEVVYPIVTVQSSGSKLVDVDGNEYVDLLCGFGPTFLGHSPPPVVAAIEKQLAAGFEIGPQTPLAGETAALVCELTGMDRASFVCTGSEAVQAAIRCARATTGRDRIALFRKAYHGNFDEVLVRGVGSGDRLRTLPSAPGIPRRSVADTLTLDYGTPESLEIIRKHAHELAAVLVEPVQSRRPELQPKAFLQALRQITQEAGCALIFDEVVTGFRCHPGGAQAVFEVEADLATYGKVVAGGMPIGVVAGRKAFMDTFDGGHWQYGDASKPTAGVTFFAGTFVRHPLAIAAAHAVLTHLKAEGPALQAQLNARADTLARRLNAVCEAADVPIEIPNFGSVLFIRNHAEGPLPGLLSHHLLERGVHLALGFPSYLTTAHTDADLDHIVDAFEASVQAMLKARFIMPRTPKADRPVAATAPSAVSDTPPVPGAKLGRDPSGAPAWYAPDPERPGAFVKVG